MSSWFDHYKNSMKASRFVGITGAILLVLCVFGDIERLFSALNAGGELISTEAVVNELKKLGVEILVGVIAILRILILVWARSHSYWWQILSWWALAIGLLLCNFQSMPSSTCNDNGVCYGVYDASYSFRFIAVATLVFFIISSLRFVVTVGLATIKARSK